MKPAPALTTLGVIAFVWRSGGGFRAALRSFDLWLAVAVWVFSFGLWTTPKWADTVVSVLPNLLGFTLGGYAVFLGSGSDEFKTSIIRETEAESVYLSVSSAFMLFVAVQVFSLMYALVATALALAVPPAFLLPYAKAIACGATVGGALGYFMFCYSLALALRAAVRIFRLSRWYNMHLMLARNARRGEEPPVGDRTNII